MASNPVIAWLSRESQAALVEYARAQNEPVERIAGLFVEAELRRRRVPPVELPSIPQPTRIQQEIAHLQTVIEGACGSKDRAAALIERLNREDESRGQP